MELDKIHIVISKVTKTEVPVAHKYQWLIKKYQWLVKKYQWLINMCNAFQISERTVKHPRVFGWLVGFIYSFL